MDDINKKLDDLIFNEEDSKTNKTLNNFSKYRDDIESLLDSDRVEKLSSTGNFTNNKYTEETIALEEDYYSKDSNILEDKEIQVEEDRLIESKDNNELPADSIKSDNQLEKEFTPITKAEYNRIHGINALTPEELKEKEEKDREENYWNNYSVENVKPIESPIVQSPSNVEKDKMTGLQKLGCFCLAFFLQIVGVLLNIFVIFKNKKNVALISVIGMISGVFTAIILPIILGLALYLSLPSEYKPYDYSNDINITYSQELEDKIPVFTTESDFNDFYNSLTHEEMMVLEKFPVSYKDYWEEYYKRYDWYTIEFIEGKDGAEYIKEYSWNIDDGNQLEYVVVKGHDSNNKYYFDMSEEGNDLVYNELTDTFKETPYNQEISV